MYVGIDPGPFSGIARVNNRGVVLDLSIVALDKLAVHLEAIPTQGILAVVMEKYRQLPFKSKALMSRKTNKLEVAQAEGIVKSWCDRHGLKLVEQDATVLPIAMKHTGIKMPSDHAQSHAIAGLLHVKEWMIREGIDRTLLELEHEAKE